MNRNRSLLSLALALLLLLPSACGSGGSEADPDPGWTRVTVRLGTGRSPAGEVTAAAVPADVLFVEVSATGPDMEPVVEVVDVEPEQEEVRVVLRVPNGLDRTIRVDAYGAGEPPVLLFEGQTTADLDGSPVHVHIPMTRVGPDTLPPGFDGLQTATPASASSVSLAWNATTDDVSSPAEIDYLVFFALDPGGQDFGAPDLVVTGQTSALVQDLDPATTYFFVVRARDAAGNTETNAVERSATTPPLPDTTPPDFDGLASATAESETSVALSWSSATDDESPPAAIDYLVFAATTSGGQTFASPDAVITGELSTTVQELLPETTYFFVVRARDEAGNTEENTQERSATTPALPDTTPPTFAGLQSGDPVNDTSVWLRWSAASDDSTPSSAIDYLVFHATTSGGQDFGTPDEVVTGDLTAEVQDLAPGSFHYFVVRARDGAGNTETNAVEREIFTPQIQDETAPLFNGLISATASSPTQVVLTWGQASDDMTPPDAMDYLVFHATTPGGQDFETPDRVVTGQLSTVINGLAPDTTHYFVVRARDRADNQDSNVVEEAGTTPAAPDTTPPVFGGVHSAVAASETAIDLAWNAAFDTGTPPADMDYLVFVATTPGGQDFETPDLVVTGVLSAQVPGLAPGTPYFFVVRARDEAGNTDGNIFQRSGTTLPDSSAPVFGGIQSAVATSETTIDLAWNAAADDFTPPAAIDYLVFVALTPGGQDFETPDLVVTGDLSAELSGLDPGTPYHIVVRARDEANNTDANTVEITEATPALPDTTPPLFGGVQSAVATSETTIELTWNAAFDAVTPPAAIDYLVFVATTSGGQNFTAPDLVVTGFLSAEVPGLTPGTPYFFVVRARDEAGNTDPNTVELTETTPALPDTTPPTFDGVQTADGTSETTVELTWNAATDDTSPPAAIDYLVFYDETSGGQSFDTPDLVVTGDLSAEVPGLAPGNTYFFVVRARDEAGNTETNTVELPATTSSLMAWDTTTELPIERLLSVAAAPGNGFLYIISGYTDDTACSVGRADGRVFFAEQNLDGTLGPWQETTGAGGNFQRAAAGVAVNDGIIYVAGGAVNAPSWDGNVWFGQLNPDGTVASWTESANVIGGWVGSWPVMATYNGYLYVGGGRIAFGGYSDRLYYSELGGDGQPGPWTETTLPTAAAQGQLLITLETAYLVLGIDGCDGCNSNRMFTADVNPDGSLGPWTEENPLPGLAQYPALEIIGFHLFLVLGGTEVYSNELNPDGSLSNWVAEVSIPESALPFDQGLVSDTVFYLIGDQRCSATSERLKRVRYEPFIF